MKIMELNMKLLAVLLIVCLEGCSALYFHMGETEKKCFLEEIPDETMVTGMVLGHNRPKLSDIFVPLTCHSLFLTMILPSL